jgi:hypothetical protein
MLQLLIVALIISLAVSSTLSIALVTPLHAVLRQICPAIEGENFWARFTLVMLFVGPMLVALIFGVPDAYSLDGFNVGQLVRKVISATLFGAFATVAGIGWTLASFAPARVQPRTAQSASTG